MDKKGTVAGAAFMILLLILLGASIYFLYLNLPGEPVELITKNGQDRTDFIENSESKQFYDNMRYRDKQITYKIEEACESDKSESVREAFSLIEDNTLLDFIPDSQDPEITVFCTDIAPPPEREGYFVAGEGGPTEVINTSLYGVILSGKVSFFREEKCDNPNIALHEILHALGFDHNNNPDSILYPTLDCDQTLDASIIRDINRLYSVKSAADLEISKIEAVKSGRYINFDIEVINRGLKDADGVKLSIFADGEFIKEFDLNLVPIGTTKILQVENLRASRSSETITFVVDNENEIEEIFENNNQIVLTVEDN